MEEVDPEYTLHHDTEEVIFTLVRLGMFLRRRGREFVRRLAAFCLVMPGARFALVRGVMCSYAGFVVRLVWCRLVSE